MVKFKREATGPGQVIDRRGAGGGATGPACARSGWAEVPLASSSSCSSPCWVAAGILSGLTEVLQPAGGVQPETGNTLDPSVDPETDLAAFLEEVLQDTQAMWVGVFEESGLEYRPTNLVLFNGFTQSECGGAQAQSGPHYCPIDEFVYTDLDFWPSCNAGWRRR